MFSAVGRVHVRLLSLPEVRKSLNDVSDQFQVVLLIVSCRMAKWFVLAVVLVEGHLWWLPELTSLLVFQSGLAFFLLSPIFSIILDI